MKQRIDRFIAELIMGGIALSFLFIPMAFAAQVINILGW